MKLLITTQAVDLDDPVLGFFHRWLEEFAKGYEHIEVICLKEGRHALPKHVQVHSLGKECGRSRLTYLARFYRYIWALRKEYDAVFVHMNQEYVLLGAPLWKLSGKRVVLWRNHKMGSWLTRLASACSYRVCYTSPSAYVAGYRNAVKMPIGIDTVRFSPKPDSVTASVLFLGRLDEVKKPDVFLDAMRVLQQEHPSVRAYVYGDPTPGREAYAQELKARFSSLQNVSFRPGVRNDETPDVYAAHAVYVNLTPSGSFDKTIGEAMASGCVCVVANDVLRGVIPDALLVNPDDPTGVARGIRHALGLSSEERREAQTLQRAYIEKEHSLSLLASRLFGILAA